MRPLLLGLMAIGLATFAPARDAKKELAREVVLNDAKLAFKVTKPGLPLKIETKDDLAKLLEDKDPQAALAKAIDFDKEFALIFAWSGSGGDRLIADAEKETMVFSIKRGMTKDLRGHARIYALAKGTEWKFAE